MSKKAGNLLWRRMRITLAAGTGGEFPIPSRLDVDTGITQLQKGFDNDSLGEPGFDLAGAGDPTRVQVVPLSPIAAWGGVTIDDPVWDLTTETMHVVFHNSATQQVEINVLFWDPHSLIGPGRADTYNP